MFRISKLAIIKALTKRLREIASLQNKYNPGLQPRESMLRISKLVIIKALPKKISTIVFSPQTEVRGYKTTSIGMN